MNKNVVAIIEARTGSKRFHEKVLMKINGKTLIQILVERLKKSSQVNKIVLATTTKKNDLKLVNLSKKLKIFCYRGRENDVLDRVTKAAIISNAKVIVQLTGDNPLIDYELIDKMVLEFKRNKKIDFLTNSNFGDNITRTYPIGTDIKIFDLSNLILINNLSLNKSFREHPSLYFYSNKFNLFKIKNINLKSKYLNLRPRLTVDTKEDFELISIIYKRLYSKNKYFNINDILEFLDKNKDILYINNKIKQKKVKLKY